MSERAQLLRWTQSSPRTSGALHAGPKLNRHDGAHKRDGSVVRQAVIHEVPYIRPLAVSPFPPRAELGL
jgi:hypothetical protein